MVWKHPSRASSVSRRRFIFLLSFFSCLAALVWGFSLWTILQDIGSGRGFPLGDKFPPFEDIIIYHSRFTVYHTAAFFKYSPRLSSFAYPPADAPIYAAFYKVSAPATVYICLAGLWTLLASAGAAWTLRGFAPTTRSRVGVVCMWILFSFPLVFLAQRSNVELFVWMVITLGVVLYGKRYFYAAAFCLGLAASLKLYPILLLGVFLNDVRRLRVFLFGLASFAGTTFLAIWYAGPTVAIAARGFVNGLMYFKASRGESARTVEIVFDHSFFVPLKLLGLHGLLTPQHYVTIYYLVLGMSFTLLFLLRVRSMPFLNRLTFLTAAMVSLPPVSYEYTLVHLYMPLVFLLVALQYRLIQQEALSVSELLALGSLLLLTVPFGLLESGTLQTAGLFQVPALALLSLTSAMTPWPTRALREATALSSFASAA